MKLAVGNDIKLRAIKIWLHASGDLSHYVSLMHDTFPPIACRGYQLQHIDAGWPLVEAVDLHRGSGWHDFLFPAAGDRSRYITGW